MKHLRIGFLGAGSIARAILSGLVKQNEIMSENVTLLNRTHEQRLVRLKEEFHLRQEIHTEADILASDIVIFAVKPKDIQELMSKWGSRFQKEQTIISVIAGVTTSYLESFLLDEVAVVRAMPNTSSAVGQSATALCKGTWAKERDLSVADQIFSTIGTVTHVPEQWMDAVTGLSGSGPAYVYYLVEAMQKGGVSVGLEEETARELILQTLLGVTTMLKETGKDPSHLRREVTSEGGTTFAGLQVLQEYKWENAIVSAIQQATARSKELGQMFQ